MPSLGIEGGVFGKLTGLGSVEAGYLPGHRLPQMRIGGLAGVICFTVGVTATTTLKPHNAFQTLGWVAALPYPFEALGVSHAPFLDVEPFARGEYAISGPKAEIGQSYYEFGMRLVLNFGGCL